jgi:hypothetical protein
MENKYLSIFRINVTLPPVNPNGFRRPGCAAVRRSNFRSGQVQYKMGFDFHCYNMVQNLYISPKYLRIFEERHLLYMLANFFGE